MLPPRVEPRARCLRIRKYREHGRIGSRRRIMAISDRGWGMQG